MYEDYNEILKKLREGQGYVFVACTFPEEMEVRMIDYKCEFYEKEMVKINRFFPSSKTCNQCGVIKEGLKLSDRVFKCVWV